MFGLPFLVGTTSSFQEAVTRLRNVCNLLEINSLVYILPPARIQARNELLSLSLIMVARVMSTRVVQTLDKYAYGIRYVV